MKNLANEKSRELLIDSFGGKIVSREEASRITGVTLNEKDFEPVSNRDIITRMLRNLIQSAEREEDSLASFKMRRCNHRNRPKRSIHQGYAGHDPLRGRTLYRRPHRH